MHYYAILRIIINCAYLFNNNNANNNNNKLREFVFSYYRHLGLWRVLGRARPPVANVVSASCRELPRAAASKFQDRRFRLTIRCPKYTFVASRNWRCYTRIHPRTVFVFKKVAFVVPVKVWLCYNEYMFKCAYWKDKKNVNADTTL